MSAPNLVPPGTTGGGAPVGGSGTIGTVPKWATSTTLGNSVITESGGNVGIGAPIPVSALHVLVSTPGGGTIARFTNSSGANANASTQVIYQDASGGGIFTPSLSGWYSRESDGNSHYLASGNARVTILGASGNVGIGTTGPTANLQVAQGTSGVGIVSNSALGTTVTGGGTQFLNTFKVGDTITIVGQTVAITAIASDTSMTTAAITNANSGVSYTLVGGTRFSVLGNGNVGIGTASPSGKLVVASTTVNGSFVHIDGSLFNGSSNNSNNVGLKFLAQNSAQASTEYGSIQMLNQVSTAGSEKGRLRFFVADSGPLNEVMSILGGNVGIGTTSPVGLLNVRAALNATNLNLTSTTEGVNSYVELRLSSGDATGIYPNRAALIRGYTAAAGTDQNELAFFTASSGAPAEAMRITYDKKVGIGTASPSRLLTLSAADATIGPAVAQTTMIRLVNTTTTLSTGAGIQFGHDNNNAQTLAQISEVLTSVANQWTGDLAISLKASSSATVLTEYVRFQSGGNVGIGTPAPGCALDVVGVIKTSGYTVTTLPAGAVGQRAYVTDALAPTYLGALVAGGAVIAPVFHNGTAWVSA